MFWNEYFSINIAASTWQISSRGSFYGGIHFYHDIPQESSYNVDSKSESNNTVSSM